MRIQTITCKPCGAEYGPMELRDESWRVRCLACETPLFIRGKPTKAALVLNRNTSTMFRELDLLKVLNQQLLQETAVQSDMLEKAVEWIVKGGGISLEDVVPMLQGVAG